MIYDELKIKDIKGAEDLSISQLSNVVRFINEFNKYNVSIKDFLALYTMFIGMDTSEERATAINYTKELENEKNEKRKELPDNLKMYNAIVGSMNVSVEPHYVFARNKGVIAIRYKDYDIYTYNVDINKMAEAMQSVMNEYVGVNSIYKVNIK